jgi:hypothetical protein
VNATLTKVAGILAAKFVADAWQVYRRAQEVAFGVDGAGDLMAAQSRLFGLAEPSASGRVPALEADLEAIEDAVDALVAAVEWACGTGAAAYVAGDGEGRAAS